MGPRSDDFARIYNGLAAAKRRAGATHLSRAVHARVTEVRTFMQEKSGSSLALRGAAITFVADPFEAGDAIRYESDAVVAMHSGLITHFGAAADVLPKLPPGTEVTSIGRGKLIVPGF